MSLTSPTTSISGEATKLFLRHEGVVSVDFTRLFSKVMVTSRFQNGVNIAKNVASGSESYILAVFRALKVKLWQ